MAGIMNHTARQYNLKCIGKNGNRVTVRLAPGFNVVDDAHWQEFIHKDGKKADRYVMELKKAGNISFGKAEDDMELDRDADTKSKSKSEPVAKLKADLVKASEEANKANAETEKALSEAVKAKAEAEKAKAEAEKANLELAELKAGLDKPSAKSEKSEKA